ncbi:hypothetical protein GCM10017556_02500 [Micromonospora sagamiensis]|nr:hypothetical protein GCM10017556_02500 [Micromonospora sagamiensis]
MKTLKLLVATTIRTAVQGSCGPDKGMPMKAAGSHIHQLLVMSDQVSLPPAKLAFASSADKPFSASPGYSGADPRICSVATPARRWVGHVRNVSGPCLNLRHRPADPPDGRRRRRANG